MNWTDFMIAIRQGLIPSKKELVDGTTKVGDADKLDGHEAEYFQAVESETLTTSILEKALTLTQGTYEYSLGGGSYTGTDLPSSNYKYGKATVRTKGVSSTITVILWGVLASGNVIPPVFNLYNGGTWSGWQTLATTADLANQLSYYLKRYGEDNIYMCSPNDEVLKQIVLENAKRKIAIYLYASGAYAVYDETNKKYIEASSLDGTNTFNGTASGNLSINAYNSVTKNGNLLTELCIFGKTILHTGNMSSHVLPLTGGTVKSDSTVPIRVNSTNTQGMTLIDFQRDGASQGYLGFSGADNPIFYSATKGNKSLLHTGNSAKVHIGTSAPSDTSALWIDTSA